MHFILQHCKTTHELTALVTSICRHTNQNTPQLTCDSEFVKFNEKQPLVPEEHVDAPLIKLGCKEDPHCAYLRAIGAVLNLQPLAQERHFWQSIRYS